jgi:hypothetical protein
MLQAIHQKEGAPRASSIYCRWIRQQRNDGEHLLAVWIDQEMRCFEREFAANPVAQILQEDALEEPGGRIVVRSSRNAASESIR